MSGSVTHALCTTTCTAEMLHLNESQSLSDIGDHVNTNLALQGGGEYFSSNITLAKFNIHSK